MKRMIAIAVLLTGLSFYILPVEAGQQTQTPANVLLMMEKNGHSIPVSVDRIAKQFDRRVNAKSQSTQVKSYQKTIAGLVEQEIEQVWENGAWVNQSRSIVEMNDQQTVLSELYQLWQDGEWVNSGRYTIQLNANGDLTEMRFEEWRNGTWVTFMLMTSTYDAKGNEISMVIQAESDDEGVLVNALKNMSIYNDANQEIRRDDFIWDSDASDWLNTGFSTFAYNDQGLPVEEVRSMDSFGGVVMFLGKTVYEYNGSGNLLSETEQTYDMMTQGWLNSWRATHQYNAAGSETEATTQVWSGAQWENVSRQLDSFDAGEHWIESLHQSWNSTAWVNISRWQDSYSGDLVIETLQQVWDGVAWENTDKTTFAYDGIGRMETGLWQKWQGGAWVNHIRWLHSSTTSIATFQSVSDFVLLDNYPNPFNPATTIRFNLPAQDRITLQILDIAGKTIRNLTPEQNLGAGVHYIQWDGKDDSGNAVASGMYLYRVQGLRINAVGRGVLTK